MPDQSAYTPLGFQQHVKAADGSTVSSMWVALEAIAPMRGSTVQNVPCFEDSKLGKEFLFAEPQRAQCLNFKLRFWFEGIDNPNVGMNVRIWVSMDGVSEGELWKDTGVLPKRLVDLTHGPVQYRTVWKYLVVELSHNVGGSGGSQFKDPAESGRTSILLDHR